MSTQQTASHLYELPFKIRTKETIISHKSMVSVLCSMLNPAWEDMEFQGLSPLPELQGQGRTEFYGHTEALFPYFSAITDSVVGPEQKAVLRADMRHHTH